MLQRMRLKLPKTLRTLTKKVKKLTRVLLTVRAKMALVPSTTQTQKKALAPSKM